MNKKKIIIIFSIILIIVIIILLFLSKKEKNNNPVPNEETSWYQNFNPFGSQNSNNNEFTQTETEGEEKQDNKISSRFFKWTDFAISGASFYTEMKPKENLTATEGPSYEKESSLIYVERKNGHIYKNQIDTKEQSKISNSTIPSIYEAFSNEKSNTFIFRYLSSDKTISSLVISTSSSKREFLPQNIYDISLSPNKKDFFYLVKNENKTNGIISSFENIKKDIVFDSSFTEWLSQWVDNQNIYLTTKASSEVRGSIFLLNTSNKTITKVFGGIKGLTTLVNPKGSLILYNSTTGSGPRLGVFNIVNKTTKDLGVYGLPEKCIWSNDNINIYCALPNTIVGNQYPDSWYQGLISFDDYFVKINTETASITTIANSKDEIPLDATKLFTDDEEKTLFFINKKDYTLWSLGLTL